jgi:hypothetical protein
MEAITDTVDEIDPELKSAWVLTLSTGLFHVNVLCLKGKHVSLVLGNQTSDFTSSEHRVDGLEEALTLDFGVSHDESDLLSKGTSLSVQVLDIILKMSLTIGLSQRNLEEYLLTDERSKLGE